MLFAILVLSLIFYFSNDNRYYLQQMDDTYIDDSIRVVFRVKKHCNEPNSEKVGIVGNHESLGQWNTDLAPRTSFIGHGQWQLETW